LIPLIHGFLRKKDVLNGQVHQQQPCDHSVVIEGPSAKVTHHLGQADAYALRQAVTPSYQGGITK
jgi:hypothetical protein